MRTKNPIGSRTKEDIAMIHNHKKTFLFCLINGNVDIEISKVALVDACNALRQPKISFYGQTIETACKTCNLGKTIEKKGYDIDVSKVKLPNGIKIMKKKKINELKKMYSGDMDKFKPKPRYTYEISFFESVKR